MAQITTGIRAVLSLPRAYDAVQSAIGADRFRRAVVRDYLRIGAGQKLLDIGCGTARMLHHLPNGVHYVGVDLSREYIDAATREFGDRGQFHCADVGSSTPGRFVEFDVALATGLLHHLNDDEVLSMLRTARQALATGGRLVTVDPCFAHDQSRVAAFIIRKDRGQNVRTAEAYLKLALTIFPQAVVHNRNDMLRIPYNHAVLECRR